MVRTALATVAVIWSCTWAQVDLSGTVTNQAGAPIAGAYVYLIGQDISDETDAAGAYHLTGAIDVFHEVASPASHVLHIRNGVLFFSNQDNARVRIDLFDVAGKIVGNVVDGVLARGAYSVPLSVGNIAGGMYVVRAEFGSRVVLFKHLPFADTEQRVALPDGTSRGLAKSAVIRDYIHASKAGYTPKQVAVESFTGTLNIVLDSMSGIGSNPYDDGSAQRLAEHGEAQYYWGDLGGTDAPLVKITHAVVGDIADVEIVFNPNFVDNTYGENVVGWNKHTFNHIVGSDHVEVAFVNGDGDTVLYCKIDILSASADAPSGYASLGPFGGDGTIIKGDPSVVLSWGTSMDDNLNYYGYGVPTVPTSSPATDSNYTPNPDYPNWEYFTVYRMSLDKDAFGPSGYGKVLMTYVHASPSKTGTQTIEVTEKPAPEPDSPDDPFRNYTPPGETTPPDTTTTPDTTIDTMVPG